MQPEHAKHDFCCISQQNHHGLHEDFGMGETRTPHSSLCVLVQNKRRESGKEFILHSFHVVIITFKSFQIIFSIEYKHTLTVECC